MRVLITGATGLIGKAIVKQCHKKGIEVHYLTTSKNKISTASNYKGFYWNPKNNEIDSECFVGVDAIINLAGASISKRWTPSYKQQILDSRIQSLELLKSTLANENISVKQIISASAIGVYPDSLTNYYEETFDEVSPTFLGKVVNAWEDKVDTFKALNIKVTKVRIGLVLDAKEGALPEMVKPVKFGAGAAFGEGTQWQSWIHVKDLARLFVYTFTEKLEGVYNGVAPNPVTNNELIKAIAKQKKRPLLLPNIPKSIMKLLLGEMHILLFESQRVSSKKIEGEGFHFKHHHLQPTLEDLLK
ncbi:TIGR01777 family protein [Meridianimaribacter sp. CL38]|uniref:TIGR01777 family oxidoreductase n=1 Tax=Meridianimaribacter sp. CL38 TaxID=2213021 RepID=UPI00103FB1AA|nr:TIGR01777 family oxidoreductase [Meridianimaribacter sp. CL38]TBV26176.1 TIGR01777 family protein [Meridianimaribacter sp. CL38]